MSDRYHKDILKRIQEVVRKTKKAESWILREYDEVKELAELAGNLHNLYQKLEAGKQDIATVEFATKKLGSVEKFVRNIS